ncbi:MAG TPA: hypothetical protein V6C86_22110 [Oculatellaceae cyanobacterium]
MQAPEDTSISNESVNPNKQRKAWLVAISTIAVVVALCAGLWISIASHSSHEKESKTKSEEEGVKQSVDVNQLATKVEVKEIGNETPTPKITVTGSVEPNQQKGSGNKLTDCRARGIREGGARRSCQPRSGADRSAKPASCGNAWQVA